MAAPGPRGEDGAVPERERRAGQGLQGMQEETRRVPEETERVGGGGARGGIRGGPGGEGEAAGGGAAAAPRGEELGEQNGGAAQEGEEYALERRHAEQGRLQQERFQREGRGEGGDGGAEGAEAQNLRGAPREADQALWHAAALGRQPEVPLGQPTPRLRGDC